MDAINVLNDVQSASTRIQRFTRPDAKTQADYIETLRQLSTLLTDSSSHVRSLLNAVATINTLPPELLAHIFTFYATETVRIASISIFEAYEPFNYPSPRAALRLTEVCKHWRDVSLTSPSLWSGVICGGNDATPTTRYLSRSKSLPLHAIIKGDLEAVEEILDAYPSRIQHLLLVDSNSWTRRYDPRRLLINVAPDLLTCTLDLHSWPRGPSLPELGYTLFSGGASRLRTLSLHSVKLIPLDSLPNLRSLALYHILGIPSLPHILALLGRCPALEDVCVHSNREPARIALDARFEPEVVELRHIRKLALLMQNSVWLLAHLSIPASALVRVDDITLLQMAEWPSLPPPPEGTASGVLANRTRGGPLTRMRVSSPQGSPIHTGIVAELRIELAGSERGSGVCLNTAAPSSTPRERYGAAVQTVIKRSAPLFAHVTVLWAVRQSALLWPILFDLHELRVLGIVLGDSDARRLGWLTNMNMRTIASSDKKVVCPALETLCLCDFQGPASELQHLHRMVEARAQLSRPLRRLALECQCKCGEGDGDGDGAAHLAAIRAHVGELVVVSRGPAGSAAALPREWREELGWADNARWPDWEFFAESHGGSRGGSVGLG
ncbi:hypothetical protein GSI_02956 [Ganoderma sinense ZZ0214-1]|uniref:F-box domain-containing protein n=1 Tax=Ganoderma sinense ZZ0214-1 TaxID=1077348 RepID=A0A2G8SN14_9APHY|nr:hypothetical protein GSI_02956 [Ganoderma sinense ZZ0214-1]